VELRLCPTSQESLAQGLPWVLGYKLGALKGRLPTRPRGTTSGSAEAPSASHVRLLSQGKPWAQFSWPFGPKTGLYPSRGLEYPNFRLATKCLGGVRKNWLVPTERLNGSRLRFDANKRRIVGLDVPDFDPGTSCLALPRTPRIEIRDRNQLNASYSRLDAPLLWIGARHMLIIVHQGSRHDAGLRAQQVGNQSC
jgi:hypothetical protein